MVVVTVGLESVGLEWVEVFVVPRLAESVNNVFEWEKNELTAFFILIRNHVLQKFCMLVVFGINIVQSEFVESRWKS